MERKTGGLRNAILLLLRRLRGHGLQRERFLSDARSHRHSIGDRVAEEIVHRVTRLGLEREEAVVAVAREQPLALERSADAFGDPLDEPRAYRIS